MRSDTSLKHVWFARRCATDSSPPGIVYLLCMQPSVVVFFFFLLPFAFLFFAIPRVTAELHQQLGPFTSTTISILG